YLGLSATAVLVVGHNTSYPNRAATLREEKAEFEQSGVLAQDDIAQVEEIEMLPSFLSLHMQSHPLFHLQFEYRQPGYLPGHPLKHGSKATGLGACLDVVKTPCHGLGRFDEPIRRLFQTLFH